MHRANMANTPLPFNQRLIRSVRLTKKEFESLPEYSCSMPTLGPISDDVSRLTMWLKAWGRFPRKPWKQAKDFYKKNKKPSDFWVCWYDFCPKEPEKFAQSYGCAIQIVDESKIKDKESLKLRFER